MSEKLNIAGFLINHGFDDAAALILDNYIEALQEPEQVDVDMQELHLHLKKSGSDRDVYTKPVIIATLDYLRDNNYLRAPLDKVEGLEDALKDIYGYDLEHIEDMAMLERGTIMTILKAARKYMELSDG